MYRGRYGRSDTPRANSHLSSFGARSHSQRWGFSNDLAHRKYVENKSEANFLLAKKIYFGNMKPSAH